MADGFHLDLDDDLAERLSRAARSAGMSKGEFARHVLEQHLFDYDAYDWGGSDPRTSVDEPFDPQAPTRPLDEVMAQFRNELEKRLAAKA
jgi:hypothetical protein